MRLLLSLIVCVLLAACGSESQKSEENLAADLAKLQETVQGRTVELATYNVSCGCALKDVGHCGNYIEIDSKYVEIANGDEIGLNPMEWCGRSGVKVKAAGVLADNKFVAATLEEE